MSSASAKLFLSEVWNVEESKRSIWSASRRRVAAPGSLMIWGCSARSRDWRCSPFRLWAVILRRGGQLLPSAPLPLQANWPGWFPFSGQGKAGNKRL